MANKKKTAAVSKKKSNEELNEENVKALVELSKEWLLRDTKYFQEFSKEIPDTSEYAGYKAVKESLEKVADTEDGRDYLIGNLVKTFLQFAKKYSEIGKNEEEEDGKQK